MAPAKGHATLYGTQLTRFLQYIHLYSVLMHFFNWKINPCHIDSLMPKGALHFFLHA